MGWIFTPGSSKKQIIAEHTRNWTNEHGKQRRCLAHTIKGNVLWSVWEYDTYSTPERVIFCGLLRNGGKADGWGYKGMDEQMGPFYYTCPLKYLAMTPVACQDWRDKVLAYHAERKARRQAARRLKLGQHVNLIGSTIPFVTIVSLRPLHGAYLGRTYRIPTKYLPGG